MLTSSGSRIIYFLCSSCCFLSNDFHHPACTATCGWGGSSMIPQFSLIRSLSSHLIFAFYSLDIFKLLIFTYFVFAHVSFVILYFFSLKIIQSSKKTQHSSILSGDAFMANPQAYNKVISCLWAKLLHKLCDYNKRGF